MHVESCNPGRQTGNVEKGPCPAQRDGIVIGTTVYVATTVGRYTDRKLGLADIAVQPGSVCKHPVDGQWKHVVCWNAGGNG